MSEELVGGKMLVLLSKLVSRITEYQKRFVLFEKQLIMFHFLNSVFAFGIEDSGGKMLLWVEIC